MSRAQVAVAALAAVLIAAAVLLIITEHPWSAWVFGGFGLLGFVTLLGMIATDRRT